MPESTHVLDKALNDALSKAADLDEQGIAPADTGDVFPDAAPTNVELVQACTDFYHKNQPVLDRAVDDAMRFLASPDGAAYVKALEGSLSSISRTRPMYIRGYGWAAR